MSLKWLYKESNEDLEQQIFNNRKTSRAIFEASTDKIPSETLLKDIDIASQRIKEALQRDEKITIFGHDDPDGITAAYIIFDFISAQDHNRINYYIPNRIVEHHGIQDSLIDFLVKNGTNLLITVDNGIASKDKIKEINKLGIDVIVTDHHVFEQSNIPNCIAVVNPKRNDNDYPFTMLAGVGVSLMLTKNLAKLINKEVKKSYYFWVAVGSLADRVPMIDVNWQLLRYVLNNWDEIDDETTILLKSQYSDIKDNFDKMSFINYSYRLIANGRDFEGEHHGLKFLLATSTRKLEEFRVINTEKHQTEQKLNGLQKIIDRILCDYKGDGLVYFDENDEISNPLLGTLATFIVNRIHEPAIMLKRKDKTIVCEGRSCNGFSILASFKYCEDLLIQYGGHVKAAGFTMKPDKMSQFITRFKEFFALKKDEIFEHKSINIDAILDARIIEKRFYEKLDFMLPFGQENNEPIILLRHYSHRHNHFRFYMDSKTRNKLKNGFEFDIVIQVNNNGQFKIIESKESN